MPKQKKEAMAIQPAQGKRKTFDASDDSGEDNDLPVAGPSRRQIRTEDEDSGEDDSDDEAPEAVIVGSAKKGRGNEEDDAAR